MSKNSEYTIAEIQAVFAKSDEAHNLASSAYEHSARANGRAIEGQAEFDGIKRLLEKCVHEVIGLRQEVKELRGHASKHAQRLNAHRSRLNSLETSPGQAQRTATPAQFVAKAFESGTEGRDLLAKADAAISDPNLMIRAESAVNRGNLSEARKIVEHAEREKMHADLRKRASTAPQRIRDEIDEHLDRGDHQAALERVQNHERSQGK